MSDGAEAQLADLQAEVDLLTQELEAERDAALALEQELSAAQDELVAADARTRASAKQVEALQGELEAAVAAKETAEAMVGMRTGESASSSAVTEAMSSELASMRTQRAELDREMARLREALAQAEGRCSHASAEEQRRAEESGSQLHDAEQRLLAQTARLAEAERQAAAARQEVHVTAARAATLEAELAAHAQRLQRAEESASSARAEANRAQQSSLAAQQQAHQVRQQLSHVLAERSQAVAAAIGGSGDGLAELATMRYRVRALFVALRRARQSAARGLERLQAARGGMLVVCRLRPLTADEQRSMATAARGQSGRSAIRVAVEPLGEYGVALLQPAHPGLAIGAPAPSTSTGASASTSTAAAMLSMGVWKGFAFDRVWSPAILPPVSKRAQLVMTLEAAAEAAEALAWRRRAKLGQEAVFDDVEPLVLSVLPRNNAEHEASSFTSVVAATPATGASSGSALSSPLHRSGPAIVATWALQDVTACLASGQSAHRAALVVVRDGVVRVLQTANDASAAFESPAVTAAAGLSAMEHAADHESGKEEEGEEEGEEETEEEGDAPANDADGAEEKEEDVARVA